MTKRLAARLARRFRADRSGSTAIEFALIAPPLVLFTVGIVEVGIMVAGQQALEDAVFIATRTSKTGYVASGSTQQADINAAIRKAAGALLDPAKIVVTSKAYEDFSNIGQPEPFTDLNKNGVRDALEPFTDVNGNGVYDTDQGRSGSGSSSEIVLFTATYPWPLHTPLIAQIVGKNGTYELKASSAVKNEPY
ncbi:TadE family protein [Methylopila turkensis]|uniref:Pilus assembly protein TadG n=1 Tax=Methylopila turkensis TaxID=1437816 RepID=A0A9W6JR37_9HYPH|nr:TadE family protein [Methylopila turkensis]GLK81036.1 pilus assembly protein TadG [Methylopila turkensis]